MRKTLPMLACVMVVLAANACMSIEPNMDEVKSCRALVSSVSETLGGKSPAISPDGDTLAFYGCKPEGLLHILHGIRSAKGNPSQWTIETPNSSSYGRDRQRDIDWSPDGKRLAFISGQQLFVADGLDFSLKKVASLRPMISLVGTKNSLLMPRWSPDGKKIAFLSTVYLDKYFGPSRVSVVDVESDQETVLARDAVDGSDAWSQPWSRDGKYIAYRSSKAQENTSIEDGTTIVSTECLGVNVVSSDGKTRWTAIKESHTSYPGWSPKSGTLATVDYVPFKAYSVASVFGDSKVSGKRFTVITCDSHGKSRRSAYTLVPPSGAELEEINALRKAANKEMDTELARLFGDKLDEKQQTRLKNGDLSWDEMNDIALQSASEEVGGNFLKKMTPLLQKHKWNAFDTFKFGFAVKSLPEEQRDAFFDKAFWWTGFIDAPSSAPYPGDDRNPIWSPDGSRIAFITADLSRIDNARLKIVDMANGKLHNIASTDRLESITWTADGKSLVVQGTRVMSIKKESNSTSTELANPEIWLIDLK